jgi:energy-coupling factor transport system substrate-specific component
MIRYATRDWILIAAVSAVIGVFFTFLDSLYSSLSNLLGPAMDVTFGVYALSALLPLYLCRKPGSALAGSLFAAVINILTGSPYGIHIIIAGLLQGLGAEAGFCIGRYKRYGILQFVIASLFITLFVSLRDYFVFSLGQLPFPLLMLTLGLRILSVSLVSFLICLSVGAALRKAGLVKYAAES